MLKFVFILALSIILMACETIPEYEQKYQLAVDSWKQGNKAEAVQYLHESVDLNPDYYEAWLQLGNYQADQQQWEEAAKAYEAAIPLQEQDPEPLLGAGESYIEVGRSLEEEESKQKTFLTAQHNFSKVLDLGRLSEDDKFRATLGKGICLLTRTLVEDSRSYLQEALEMRPDSYTARFYEAMFRESQLGPNKKSLEVYEKILVWKPDHLEALRQLGNVYRKLEQKNLAYNYYQKFFDNGGKSTSIKDWMDKNPPITTTSSEPEYLMVCPECGRIGKKGQTVCDSDGAELIRQEKS